jgi:hypothetical protein
MHLRSCLLSISIFLSTGFLVSSCSDDDEGGAQFDSAAFEENRAKWLANKPPSYTFDYDDIYWPQGHRYRDVRVENDIVISAHELASDGTTQPLTNPSVVPIIDQLYSKIERDRTSADKIEVTYDPTFGFPSEATATFPETVLDAGWHLAVLNFRQP